MKKTIILCILLMLVCAFALAEETKKETFTSGDYQYVLLEDGTAEITAYNGWDAEVIIPDALDGHRVSSIGDRAFYYCDGLTSVTIPDSITSIGVNPFVDCESLANIKVSLDHPALETIDGVLFSKTDKRLVCYPCASTEEEYTIPQGIQSIGYAAFYDCSSLTSVTIPDSVTSIGDWAFYYCDSLTSVTIPDSVTSIGDYAFSWCYSLPIVTIPDSVTSIGDFAFSNCYSLTSVTIPDSVTSIGDDAFYNCTSLTSIIVGRDSYARQYCIDHGYDFTYPDANDWLNN